MCTVIDVNGSNGCSEDDRIPEFSHQWDEAEAEGGQGPAETEAEQKDTGESWDEKGTEGAKHASAEQKLYRIANELLQTERAYVARLHLLDQVGTAEATLDRTSKVFQFHFISRTNISQITPAAGVLLAAHRGGGSRLVSPRGGQKHLLQRFLHLRLPQPVLAAGFGEVHQPLVGGRLAHNEEN